MLHRLWNTRRAILPIPLRFILLGMTCGLIAGAMRLTVSVDDASTVGFVTFISFAIGGWLGMLMALKMLDISIACLRVMVKRADALAERIGIASESYTGQPTARRLNTVVKWSIYLMVGCAPGFTSGLVYIGLGSQTTTVDTAIMVWCTLLIASVMVTGAAIQTGKLWSMWRTLNHIERLLVTPSQVRLEAEPIDVNYGRARRWASIAAGRQAFAV